MGGMQPDATAPTRKWSGFLAVPEREMGTYTRPHMSFICVSSHMLSQDDTYRHSDVATVAHADGREHETRGARPTGGLDPKQRQKSRH